jgi:hypothetical protein
LNPLYDYQIADGYDSAGSLVNIEAITPSGDRAFAAPQAFSSFAPGVLRIRADGLSYLAGFQSFIWLFSVLTRAQWQHLQDTYSTGGNSYTGKVTVRSRNIDGTYTNYNAIINIPILPDLDRQFTAYKQVRIEFTRAVSL